MTSPQLSASKSAKQKPSVRFQMPAAPQPIKSPVKRPPPTVKFEVPHDRDYLQILHQTKMVYDQLLAAKQSRLVEDLYKVKSDYDSQCSKMADQQKAIEFGVRAQENLNKLQTQADTELVQLHLDYQAKLEKMRQSLEETWLAQHAHAQPNTGQSPTSVQGYKVYSKKQ